MFDLHDEYVRKAQVVRVVDGDTVDFRIDLGWNLSMVERCRLLDVDTPEIRGRERPQGLEYKEFVINWLSAYEYYWIRSRKYKSGKYGRTLTDIYNPDGEHLNQVLREKMREDGIT